jgi:hypothetical protein
MGRSADQTFYADHFSKTGFGVGHELRWALQSPSRGAFRSYVFEPSVEGADYDYDLDWKATQYCPARSRPAPACCWIQQHSLPAELPGQPQPGLVRNRKSSLTLQKTLPGGALLQGLADWNDVFFGDRTRTSAPSTVRLSQAAQEPASPASSSPTTPGTT